jgi:HK97 family phage portal protein
MLPGHLRGVSPVEYARQIIGLGLGAQEQAARFFGQGAVIPGVIQTSGSLTKEQMREIRDQWLQSHGGTRRSHLPVVLTGDAKYQGITMTQEQAQFLETRRYTDAQVAGQMFKVDPTMLGIPVEGSSLTYSNLEQRGTHLVRHTLLPWIVRVERGLSSLLPRGEQLKMSVDGLLRADLQSRYASYKTAAEIQQMTGEALLTVDEMRDLEDLG